MIDRSQLTNEQRERFDAYEAEQKTKHGGSVIFEDLPCLGHVIDTANVSIEAQPCGAIDHTLSLCCDGVGAYRVVGRYKREAKGARWSQFQRHLCRDHLEAWCKLHGLDLKAILKSEAVELARNPGSNALVFLLDGTSNRTSLISLTFARRIGMN